MYLKKYCLLPVLILCCITTIAQRHPEADSMMTVLKAHKEDTVKALFYYQVGEQFESFNIDSAELLYRAGYKLSNKLNYDLGKLRYPSYISAIYNMRGQYNEGLRINVEGLREARKKGVKRSIIAGLFNIANSYLLMEKFDSATAYYLESLPVIKEQNDSAKLSIAYINLSQLYRKTDQLDKSLKAAQDAVDFSKAKGGYQYLTALGSLANILLELKRFDEALTCYKEAEALANDLGAYTVLAQTYGGEAEVYWKTRRFADMKRSSVAFYETATALKNDGLIAQACYCQSYALLLNKEFAAAEPYTRQGIALALRDSNMIVLEKLYRSKSFQELTKGNASVFWDYYDRADSLDAVSMNMIVLRNTQDLESKYQAKEQAQQIRLQSVIIRQKHLWNGILTGSIIALVLLVLIACRAYLNRKKLQLRDQELHRQRIAQLEQQQQLAATEAVLQGENTERARLAKDLHDGLGGMLSGIKFSFGSIQENLILTPETQLAFERSMDMLNSSIQELRRTAHNMMPESLMKFGLDAALRDNCSYLSQPGGVKVSYQSIGWKDAAIKQDVSLNVYRIVQELLNNAIKHAGASEILVQLTHEAQKFTITVEDNGKGMDPAKMQGSTGVGWTSIRNRVAYLQGHLDIDSSDKGTSVYIQFAVEG